ncbi:MAG: class II aldolase/adducin family protein [Betaproteobacteria bacterium]
MATGRGKAAARGRTSRAAAPAQRTASRRVERLARFPPDEWAARVELAACYRIFARLGWVELIYNHITLRLPGPEKHFLINPFGLLYSEVRASNLVKVDLAGNIIGRSDWPVNPAGFTIHAAIHDSIAGAHCVMHTHTTAGMAVACSQSGLSMSNFYSAQLYGKLAYHDFEGITLHADEGPRLVRAIGDKPAVILRNHGLLAWGDTVARTFAVMWLLNRACEIQLASTSMGTVIEVSEDIQRKCTRDSLQFSPVFGAGGDVFDALTRDIERVDPSYKT